MSSFAAWIRLAELISAKAQKVSKMGVATLSFPSCAAIVACLRVREQCCWKITGNTREHNLQAAHQVIMQKKDDKKKKVKAASKKGQFPVQG